MLAPHVRDTLSAARRDLGLPVTCQLVRDVCVAKQKQVQTYSSMTRDADKVPADYYTAGVETQHTHTRNLVSRPKRQAWQR